MKSPEPKAPRGRPKTETVEYKVSLPLGTKPMLESLASLGLYGSTPTEVLRRLALEGIENKVFALKVLDSTWAAPAAKPSKKK